MTTEIINFCSRYMTIKRKNRFRSGIKSEVQFTNEIYVKYQLGKTNHEETLKNSVLSV